MSQPEFQQYQQAFCAYARNPKSEPRPPGVDVKRIAIYAELLFNNMESTLSSCFPVCRKVLGVRRWQRLVRAFFTAHRCTTPLFRQIPEEFLRWLDEADLSGLPPFLPQLAHYEWVELAVAVSDAPMPAGWEADRDLLDNIPVLTPALMLLAYDWPVQKISPRFKPNQPLPEPLWLLVFRDVADEVRFNEINPVSAQLIRLLQPGMHTGRAALAEIAHGLGHDDPAAIIAFGGGLLQELRERGAILGAMPCK
jgi:hypothetical protein